MAWLRSILDAYIICYNGYISRDNLRCGAISNYLLYTGVCSLGVVVIVNISSFFATNVIAPNPVISGRSEFSLDTIPSFLRWKT